MEIVGIKMIENSLVRSKHDVFQNQCQPQSLPWSVHLTIRQRWGHRFYEQLTIFIPSKTYEGDSVQRPWAQTRVPGFEFCSTSYHVYSLWPLTSSLCVCRSLVGRWQSCRFLPHEGIVRNE